MELLRDLDKETVDFGRTTTSRSKSAGTPGALPEPARQRIGGIAVGMATNIPPHNLGEVIDAASMLIDNQRHDRRLMTVLPAGLPDRRHGHGTRRDPLGV